MWSLWPLWSLRSLCSLCSLWSLCSLCSLWSLCSLCSLRSLLSLRSLWAFRSYLIPVDFVFSALAHRVLTYDTDRTRRIVDAAIISCGGGETALAEAAAD